MIGGSLRIVFLIVGDFHFLEMTPKASCMCLIILLCAPIILYYSTVLIHPYYSKKNASIIGQALQVCC